MLLLYVTLDLSLASMPGAFVFDPDDSVESLQGVRARDAAAVVALPPLDAMAFPPLLPAVKSLRPRPAARAAAWRIPVARHWPRVDLIETAPESDDVS